MLEKLRELIRSGGTYEVQSLANELGTTPDLVRMMLEKLEQMGVVRANSNCESGCDHCGLKLDCKASNLKNQKNQIWEVVQPLA
jgi:hypothetical protein